VNLLLKGDLHNSCVVSVGDEGDDNIVTLDGLSESIGGRDINRHGSSVGELGSECFGSLESPAGDSELVLVLGDVVCGWWGDKTGTEEENLLLAGLGLVGVVP